MEWAISEWHQMEFEEIKKYDKYIVNIIESYFKIKNYNITHDGDAIDRNNNEHYHFESHGGIITIFFHELNSENYISLYAFIDFPRANWKYYSNVFTPSPIWAIGFIEKFIQVFDSIILPSIKNRNDAYEKLLKQNQEIYQEFKTKSIFPITGEMTKEWYEENNTKHMEVKFLSKIPENKIEIKKKIINLTTG